MSRWTPSHSAILSRLLDVVIGTHDMVEFRKDICKISDRVDSNICGKKEYFTGSKAEGLYLPGSDVDYMKDINERYDMQIIEQGKPVPQSHRGHLFMMVTDNVHPAFAMLRMISPICKHHECMQWLQIVDGSYFLSSFLTVLHHFLDCPHENSKMQGPSLEHCNGGVERDIVFSIHCSFWPSLASEWRTRDRLHDWPENDVTKKIVDFGFHLVPIGYPHSPRSMMEWRISFSVAERLLVWSFNHIQVQLYALLKLILKEFIKANCSSVNFVLCSYFIKTFLFWKFEETEKSFWRLENFINCLKYLMVEFKKVLQCGILKHYFIPNFNILQVKMTKEAQLELLQLYDMAIQYDIGIIGKCPTITYIWEIFSTNGYQPCRNTNNYLHAHPSKLEMFINANNIFECALTIALFESILTHEDLTRNIDIMITATDACTETTTSPLISMHLRGSLLMYKVSSDMKILESNKVCYNRMRLFDKLSTDITTGKLWTAISYFIKADYINALLAISRLLSSIPAYAAYGNAAHANVDFHAFWLYMEKFVLSQLDFSKILRKAWIFDFFVPKNVASIMPTAIQMELVYSPDDVIFISPFTVAYYLQFLCYHGLGQYRNRDRALRQLVEVAENPEQVGLSSIRYRTYNVAGHCLRFVGEAVRAVEMFRKSCELKLMSDGPNGNKHNAATFYLS